MSFARMAGAMAIALALAAGLATAQETGTEAKAILDSFGSWRMFSVLKTPEIAMAEGVKSIKYDVPEHYFLNGESPAAPAGWMKPEFNDSEWLRGPIGMGSRATWLSRACARGKFMVTDPAQVKSLKLSVAYHGGVAVYLNGEEVTRKNLAAGANLAEEYPSEAFVGPEGFVLVGEGGMIAKDGKIEGAGKLTAEGARRMTLRDRKLEAEIPAKFLRKGVNVLAVEVVRAPYDKAIELQMTRSWDRDPLYNMVWNTCELNGVELTAEGKGVEASTTRPAVLQVWNSSLLRTDFTLDSGGACETTQPIVMSGTRNGVFSGKAIVGSTNAIKGLKATVSDLRGEKGTIAGSAMRVRYAIPGGAEYGIDVSTFGVKTGAQLTGVANAVYSNGKAEALNILMETAPEKYEAGPKGAVAPVWVTVKVAGDTKAGVYKGKLTVSAEGETPVEAPIELKVADWKLPDPGDFQTWAELIESPDTLKLEYNVPMWSDKHFELIGRSFRYMHEVGSKVVYVPLICCTNMGNEESMVRWIKKGENDYDFDFTVMDKYLDTMQKNLGKPKVVGFLVWEVFMLPSIDLSVGGSHQNDILPEINKYKDRMRNPWVTTVDQATGKVDRMEMPDYFNNENAKKAWTKLFTALHERMKKRGLEDTMMLGWFTDIRAQKGEVGFWKDVSGDLPWVSHAHWKLTSRSGGIIKTGYTTSIHDTLYPSDPSKGRRYGWVNSPVIWAQQLLRPGWRGEMDMLPATMWSSMEEITISGGQRGFGRLGGDFWFVLKDKNGQRVARVYDRYPWSVWPNQELCCSLLAPGPEGAVVTAHFEQLREGIQESEAKIYIEQALTDTAKKAKLGDELAGRCQGLLDERVLFELRGMSAYYTYPHDYAAPWKWIFQTGVAGHAWFQSSGWRERNERLFALAGEVSHKLETN